MNLPGNWSLSRVWRGSSYQEGTLHSRTYPADHCDRVKASNTYKYIRRSKKRGIGAYTTQLSSVRLKNNFTKDGDLRKGKTKRLSPEEWGEARKIAFVYKSLYEDMKIKPQDLDLYTLLKSVSKTAYANICLSIFCKYFFLKKVYIIWNY